MSLKQDWSSFCLILFMLGVIFYFGYQSKPTEMGLVIVGCAIALSFVNIDKIKKFKGAGFEAEMSSGTLTTSTADLDAEKIKKYGDPDQFKLLFKVQGQGWRKSTKAIQVENAGCVVQVTTERKNASGEWINSEALTYAPDAKLKSAGNNLFTMVKNA